MAWNQWLWAAILSAGTSSAALSQGPYQDLLNDMRRESRPAQMQMNAPISSNDVVRYEAFLETIHWPDASKLSQFKDLEIGESVDLDSPILFDIQVDMQDPKVGIDQFFEDRVIEYPEAVFVCLAKVLVYCRLERRSTYSKIPVVQQLSTAFETRVDLNILIVPDRPVVEDKAITGSPYGKGRVARIWLRREDTDGALFRRSVEYFSEQVSAPPLITRRGGEMRAKAAELYAEQCQRKIEIIKAKPVILYSEDDKSTIKRCNDIAGLPMLDYMVNPPSRVYSWIDAEKNLNIYTYIVGDTAFVSLEAKMSENPKLIMSYFESKSRKSSRSREYQRDF